MFKKLMSLGIVGIVSMSLMVGCSGSNTDDTKDNSSETKVEERVNKPAETDKKEQGTNSKEDEEKPAENQAEPKNNKANTKKDTKDDSNEDAGVRHPAVEENNEEWCPVCQEWYDPDKESHNCEVPDDYYEPEEDDTQYYGIDGNEQTEEDWNRQNDYIEKGYNGHIDDNGDAYWTDDEGNEYR